MNVPGVRCVVSTTSVSPSATSANDKPRIVMAFSGRDTRAAVYRLRGTAASSTAPRGEQRLTAEPGLPFRNGFRVVDALGQLAAQSCERGFDGPRNRGAERAA